MNKPNVRFTTTPAGEEIVLLSREDFEELTDLVEHYAGLAEARAHPTRMLESDEVEALLDAPTPLHFWRRKRGLTQAELAQAAGVSQAAISALESGQREGMAKQWKRIASALDLDIADLVN
jgi:DNA-binding XRE family transcriptional regulator